MTRCFFRMLGAAALFSVLLSLAALLPANLAMQHELRAVSALYERVQKQEIEELTAQVQALDQDLARRRQTAAGLNTQVHAYRRRIDQAYERWDAQAVSGAGVFITLDDADPDELAHFGAAVNPNWFLVHDGDLVRVVAALRAAGAQAVAINRHRLGATTRIRCTGPAILIGIHTIAPPFEIQAIGDPQALMQALGTAEGAAGIRQELSAFGIVFTIQQKDMLYLPAADSPKMIRMRMKAQNLED